VRDCPGACAADVPSGGGSPLRQPGGTLFYKGLFLLRECGMEPQMTQRNADLQRDPETYAIIGAAMEVHRELGNGFLEAVYQDALQLEFKQRRIPFTREQSVPVLYKGVALGAPYRADFVCHGSVLVELKAIKALTDVESAQVLHYLKATGFERALLINFATPRLDYKRFIRSGNHPRKPASSAVHVESGGNS
jgi:GxxExxY protein